MIDQNNIQWIPLNENINSDFIDQVSLLLENQWPSFGGINSRKRHLIRSCDCSKNLPTNFIAVLKVNKSDSDDNVIDKDMVIGHICLKPASEVTDGSTSIVYSVLVAPSYRRNRIGQYLMKMIEIEARNRGYVYIYLYTPDQQLFYESCQYKLCNKISTKGKVIKNLSNNSINKLSELMTLNANKISAQSSKRMTSNTAAAAAEVSSTNEVNSVDVTNDNGDIEEKDSIWLRKLLIESTLPQCSNRNKDIKMMIEELIKHCTIRQDNEEKKLGLLNDEIRSQVGKELFNHFMKKHSIMNKDDTTDDDINSSCASSDGINSNSASDNSATGITRYNIVNNNNNNNSSDFIELEISDVGIFDGVLLDMDIEKQVGPTCGLAALRMLSSFMKNDRKYDGKIEVNRFQNKDNNKDNIIKDLSCSNIEKISEEHDDEFNTTLINRNVRLLRDRNSQTVYYPNHKRKGEVGKEDEEESLLQAALRQNMPYEGEIFSAYNLASLGADFWERPVVVSRINKHVLLNTLRGKTISVDGEMSHVNSSIVSSISGVPVILAYDRDLNTHLPIQNNGLSSHWACLRGYLRYKPFQRGDTENGTANFNGIAEVEEEEVIILLFSHGMSLNPMVCTLNEFMASNNQLKTDNLLNKHWIVPDGESHLSSLCLFPALGI